MEIKVCGGVYVVMVVSESSFTRVRSTIMTIRRARRERPNEIQRRVRARPMFSGLVTTRMQRMAIMMRARKVMRSCQERQLRCRVAPMKIR